MKDAILCSDQALDEPVICEKASVNMTLSVAQTDVLMCQSERTEPIKNRSVDLSLGPTLSRTFLLFIRVP